MSTFINEKGNEEAVSYYLKSYPNEKYFNNFHKITPLSEYEF